MNDNNTEKTKKTALSLRLRNYLFPVENDKFIDLARKLIFDVAIVTLVVAISFISITYAIPGVITFIHNKQTADIYTPGSTTTVSVSASSGAPMLTDMAALYAKNHDTVGYLYVANDKLLQLPVVQTVDNIYYLHHVFDTTQTDPNVTKHGALFVSFDERVPTADDTSFPINTMIYGHHMQDLTMFNNLCKYETLSFYKQNPVIEYDSLYTRAKWQVFASVLTSDNGNEQGGLDYPNATEGSLSAPEQFAAYMKLIAERSLINTGITPTAGDKILTLSTCEYTFPDHCRFVVFARLIKPDEKVVDKSASATMNKSVIYPLQYYKYTGNSQPKTLDSGAVTAWQNAKPATSTASSK